MLEPCHFLGCFGMYARILAFVEKCLLEWNIETDCTLGELLGFVFPRLIPVDEYVVRKHVCGIHLTFSIQIKIKFYNVRNSKIEEENKKASKIAFLIKV